MKKLQLPPLFSLILILFVLSLSQAGCQRGLRANELHQKGTQMWNEENYEDAARHFLILADFYPRSTKAPEALYWAASLENHYLKNHERATPLYERHLSDYPKSKYTFPARESLASIYAQVPDTANHAIALYQQIIKDAPPPEKPLFMLKAAETALKYQLFLQARSNLHSLITEHSTSPQAPRAHYLAAYSYFLEGYPDIAIIAFKKVAEKFKQHPTATDALIFIADTLEQQGKMKQALIFFRQAEKNPYAHRNLIKKRTTKLKQRIRQGLR